MQQQDTPLDVEAAEEKSRRFGERALANVPGLRERVATPIVASERLTKEEFLRRYNIPG